MEKPLCCNRPAQPTRLAFKLHPDYRDKLGRKWIGTSVAQFFRCRQCGAKMIPAQEFAISEADRLKFVQEMDELHAAAVKDELTRYGADLCVLPAADASRNS